MADSWIAREALRLKNVVNDRGELIFETGYGPSGLPHIGTFAEVYRTSMILKAFKAMNPTVKCFLYAFSDDMDGLRKIPDNVPNHEMLKKYIGVALTSIPDPFGTHESYGAHMNSRFCSFLDQFGFQYEFKSATTCYKSGIYDDMLLKVLNNYEQIVELVLPLVGEDRAKTYSPFLPICPKTARVLQVPITKINKDKGTVCYYDDENNEVEASVVSGGCKLQWRIDWGMRWAALGIGYEMHGKDLASSAEIALKACEIIGGHPPRLFRYELFLDEHGKKISKSKGNGLGIDEWLSYAPIESLKFYLFQDPGRARKLYFDVIPKSVDDYLAQVAQYDESSMSLEQKINNAVWYINEDTQQISCSRSSMTFATLLNLASILNTDSKEVIWGFIRNYDSNLSAAKNKFLDKLINYALKYYNDFVRPLKVHYIPTNSEKVALLDLLTALKAAAADAEDGNIDAQAIQNIVLSSGKRNHYENTREWFLLLYKTFFGQEDGPRIGSFIKIYGIDNFIALIEKSLKPSDAK